jgi:sugar lactone lactonase YvrE
LLGQTVASGEVQDFGQVGVSGTPSSLILSYSFSGLTAAPSFSLAWSRDFQATPPVCIAAGATNCSIGVTFSPLRPGLRQDLLTVSDQSGRVLASTPLRGMGTSPLLALYPGIISTLAGNGTGGYLDSVNPTLAEFWNPQGVALDGSANSLYVADAVSAAIRKIVLSTGAVSTVAGNGSSGLAGDGGPAKSASLNTPTGVAVDGGGNLYIADQGNNLIRRVDAVTQIITTVAGGGTTPSGTDTFGDGGPATSAILYGPQSVAVDSSGNLFIADAYHQLVRTVSAATGVITVVAGGGASAGTDGFGDGGAATSAQLHNPSGVALDSSGNLYIADTGSNLIRRVDVTTRIITAVAGNGTWGYSGDYGLATAATLASPQGVAVDAADNVYVADYGNNAIRQVSAASLKIFTLAGRGSTGYYGDGGNPTVAFLTNPMGITVDENGNLYIDDSGNNVVRQVSYAAWPLSFESEPVGALSPSQVVSPFNVGNETLNLSAISLTRNFQQVSTGLTDCAAGTALTPGSSCDTAMSFAPILSGAITGTASLTTNSLNNLASVETVNLSATGLTEEGPQVSLSATTLTFSGQSVGASGPARTVTLTNSGGSAFAISNIWLSGSQASDFQISTNCGSSLAASASCTVSVIFTPSATGARSATLLFSDLVIGSPQSVALNGTGNAGLVIVSGTSLSFAGAVGVTTAAQSVSLANTGSYPAQIFGASINGINASEFHVSTSCGSTIAAGGSCSFSVTFSAAAIGSSSASLTITDDAAGSPQTITLSGTVPAKTRTGPPSRAVWSGWYSSRPVRKIQTAENPAAQPGVPSSIEDTPTGAPFVRAADPVSTTSPQAIALPSDLKEPAKVREAVAPPEKAVQVYDKLRRRARRAREIREP